MGQGLAIQANEADHHVRVAVLLHQGSITVDGVSLTLATVNAVAGFAE